VLLTAYRAWKYSRLPLHARLELYPVPKEGGGRARYGGSYYEESKWWSKPRTLSKANETKDILMEMLFIRKLFDNNKGLWWVSYVFHIGIYCLFAWTVMLLVSTIWPLDVHIYTAAIAGMAGYCLATLGALGLLIRRIFDTDLRSYTTPVEYFNLILILLVLISGIISWLFVCTPFFAASQILFFTGLALSPIIYIHLALLGIMLIYIPASKMSHYVGKFFAFHKVLWDNDPNSKGSQVNLHLQKAAKAAQTQKPEWLAPHTGMVAPATEQIPTSSERGNEP